MFKVPDWGNDIPQADEEVVKLFTKKSKRKTAKNSGHTITKDNVINKGTNHKNKNAIRKAKGKMNGHAKLTKDDHINNRILQRNIKNNLAEAKNKNIMDTEITPGKVLLNRDKFLNRNNANNKMKHKILKRKGKFTNLESNNKSVEPNITGDINSKHNKGSCRDMNINKKPTSPQRKPAHNVKTVNDVEINNIDKQSFNSDEPDKILVNAKRTKLNDKIKDEDVDDVLYSNNYKNEEKSIGKPSINEILQKKQEKLKDILIIKRDQILGNAKRTKLNDKIKDEDVDNVLYGNNYKNEEKGIGKPSLNEMLQKKQEKLRDILLIKQNKILGNAKKTKLNDKIKDEDVDDVLIGKNYKNEEEESIVKPTKNKILQNKKEKLREILKKDDNRNVIKISSNKLRERMLQRLKAAQFRYLNEKLYTASGSESQELFKSDPVAFQTYHEGYQQQVKKWPVNPLELIVKRIQKMPKSHLIADMGCGEAALSRRVAQSVRSFDLVATSPQVEACDMAHTPLLAASVDAVVFCLALMGTNLTQYLLEANRVLKIGGHLLIAEVESRFDNVDSFSSEVQRLGFGLKKLDSSHEVFLFLEFTKQRDAPAKRSKLPALTLKPCLYKRR